MQNMSLPNTLLLALQRHAANADIEDDDELHHILQGLNELSEKVEAIKERARVKKR